MSLKEAGAMTVEHFKEKAGQLNLRAILHNSFKKRSDLEGFETSKIIATQERLRFNNLIHQYVIPNSRIKESVTLTQACVLLFII